MEQVSIFLNTLFCYQVINVYEITRKIYKNIFFKLKWNVNYILHWEKLREIEREEYKIMFWSENPSRMQAQRIQSLNQVSRERTRPGAEIQTWKRVKITSRGIGCGWCSWKQTLYSSKQHHYMLIPIRCFHKVGRIAMIQEKKMHVFFFEK